MVYICKNIELFRVIVQFIIHIIANIWRIFYDSDIKHTKEDINDCLDRTFNSHSKVLTTIQGWQLNSDSKNFIDFNVDRTKEHKNMFWQIIVYIIIAYITIRSLKYFYKYYFQYWF